MTILDTLNTYEEVKALVSVGMPEEQAEHIVDLIERKYQILAIKALEDLNKDFQSNFKDFQSNFLWIKATILFAIGLLMGIIINITFS